MRKSSLTLFFLLALAFTDANASGRSSTGVSFDGAIGLPSVTLSNPDGTIAGYDGLSLQGRLYTPIFSDTGFSMLVQGVLRYHDLENTVSSSSETEVANHIGSGLGVTIKFGRLLLGYDYMLMKARHYYIGQTGRKTEFDYSVGNLYGGFMIPLGGLAIGISYGAASGKIPKSETGLTKDSNYKEQTIWFHLSYDTGASLGNFAKSLVKK